MDFLVIMIGGTFGSITRYCLGNAVSKRARTAFPAGTFLINMTGAVLLGVLSGMDVEKNLYLLAGDGFLGAYTTFSTFMVEGFYFIRKSQTLNMLVYVLSSLALGVIGFFAGYNLVKLW